MNIELKNIVTNDRIGRNGLAFHATLYINGARAGIVQNSGDGGVTDIMPHPKSEHDWKPIREAEEWCKKQPPRVEYFGEKKVTIASTLENYVSALISQHLFEKEIKRKEKTSVIYGEPGISYNELAIKVPLTDIFEDALLRAKFKEIVRLDLLPLLTKDIKVLNSNISLQQWEQVGLPKDKLFISEKVIPLKPKPERKRVPPKTNRGRKI